jgi:hypothetical protein
MVAAFLLGILTTLTVIVFPEVVLYTITCLFIAVLWTLAIFIFLLLLLGLAKLFKI